MNLSRRNFLAAAAGLPALSWSAEAAAAGPVPERVTLAQILVTGDVAGNLGRMKPAFEEAKKDKAGWIFFPEGALSGYTGNFDRKAVSAAFDEVRALCKDAGVVGLIGTSWDEGAEKPHNEIRVVDRRGELASRYAKTCLTYGDAQSFMAGGHPLVHEAGGLKFGMLICNDLWVTPGFSDGPNPHLTLQQAKQGARVIFQAVNSGGGQQWREYHESNLKVRSAEAKCPIVVVNAAVNGGEGVNCTSGVVDGFKYVHELPRKGEVIRTVEFTPRADG